MDEANNVHIPENLIRRLGLQAGIRDRDLADQFVTGSSRRLEAEEQEAKRKSLLGKNIFIEVDEKDLSQEKRRLLKDTVRFLQDTSLAYQKYLDVIMEDYRNSRGKGVFTPKIERKLKERDYDLPRFWVKDKEDTQQFLKEIRHGDYRLSPDSLLVVFDLPKPLSRFWHRQDLSEPIQDQAEAIEWGRLYWESMPAIWEEVGREECEGTLNINRVNECGEHQPNKFYYVWEIRRQLR